MFPLLLNLTNNMEFKFCCGYEQFRNKLHRLVFKFDTLFNAYDICIFVHAVLRTILQIVLCNIV